MTQLVNNRENPNDKKLGAYIFKLKKSGEPYKKPVFFWARGEEKCAEDIVARLKNDNQGQQFIIEGVKKEILCRGYMYIMAIKNGNEEYCKKSSVKGKDLTGQPDGQARKGKFPKYECVMTLEEAHEYFLEDFKKRCESKHGVRNGFSFEEVYRKENDYDSVGKGEVFLEIGYNLNHKKGFDYKKDGFERRKVVFKKEVI